MKRLCLFLASFVFLGITFLQAQTVQISGTVTSADDREPIPGTSVSVKGTTIGTSTDFDGRYVLNVPETATILVFRFVGLKTQEVEIAGRTVIDVVLESDALALDEVVVTALGISRDKKSLGYTVQDVKGEELTRGGNSNVMTSLSGKVAGLEVRQSSGMPGSPSQIFIRGARSFSGNNSPLYVIDGMPISSESDRENYVGKGSVNTLIAGTTYANRALDIDPNDIESINVLKGQAAAALYGLRASNGVIIITTKKGKGTEIGKPVVTFNSNVTIDAISRLPEFQTDYAQGFNGQFLVSNNFAWGPKISELPNHPVYGGNSNGNPGLFFDPYKGEWVSPQGFNNPKEFFASNGYTYNNSINISNANAYGNYSVGFGATNQTGIVKETGMERYTAKMAGDFKLAEKWNIGFSGNYSDVNIKKLPSANDSWLFGVYGAPPSFDLMGTQPYVDGYLGQYRQISYRGGVGINPNWALVNNHYLEATKRFFGNTYLEFNPKQWVSIKYQIGVDAYTTNNEDYVEVGTYDIIVGGFLPTPSNPQFGFIQPTGGRINNYGLTRRTLNSLLTATFKHSFSENLNASLLVGNEFDHNQSEYYHSLGSGFTTPGWNNMANTTTQTSSYDKYARRTAGFFGNLSVDYLNMIFLNATGRYDVVSSMPRNNRGFFYPSVSGSFLFTEIDWFKNFEFLSFGKFRASYAEVGQAATEYSPVPIFVIGGGSGSGFLRHGIQYPLGGISGYKPSRTIYDPNLRPQNTANTELGIELKFLKNRLGVDYSYFYQNATDQIFSVPLAGSTGYGFLMMNAGSMETKGHELILYANPVSKKNIDWNISLNFSQINSICVELAEGVESISLGGFTTPNIRASAGDRYPAIYGESFVRDDKGRILVNENPASPNYGLPLMGEFKKVGEVQPDFILGVSNNITLFNLVSVFASLEWKQGGQIYSGTNRLMDLYGTTKKTANRDETFIYPGYKADGTPNDIVRGGESDPNALQQLYATVLSPLVESHLYETSFVKLRDAGVNIAIPSRFTKPLLIERASVGFIARNILLWTTLPNFDPETAQGQGNMLGGMDYMSLPQTTSYGFNLNLTF